MARRKSITGVKKKKPVNKAVPAKLPTPNTSSEISEESDGSITRSSRSPDVALGKRTLLSIQNVRGRAQQGHLNKSAHHTYPKSSLKPRLKHVSQATIQSKWIILDAPTQAKVESLFRSVGLPVLARHIKQTGKVEAQDAIALVTRSLCKRLPRMPFPQTTREAHFDYNGMVKNNRELQQQLLSVADSIASSKAELEKQRIEMRGERRELQRLEKSLEGQDQQSTFCPPIDESVKPEDMPDAIGLAEVIYCNSDVWRRAPGKGYNVGDDQEDEGHSSH